MNGCVIILSVWVMGTKSIIPARLLEETTVAPPVCSQGYMGREIEGEWEEGSLVVRALG
jgi:hypothetical protein